MKIPIYCSQGVKIFRAMSKISSIVQAKSRIYGVHNNNDFPKLFSLPVFLFTVNINSEEEEDSGKFENITNANLR